MTDSAGSVRDAGGGTAATGAVARPHAQRTAAPAPPETAPRAPRIAASLWRAGLRSYFFLRCRRRRITFEQPLPAGAIIFVANHLATRGPLYVGCYVPFRVHVWANANLVDRRRFVDNVSRRYLQGVLRLPPALARLVARLVFVPVSLGLRGNEVVAVDDAPPGVHATFRRTLALLAAGRRIVAFPELEHHDHRVSRFHPGIAAAIKHAFRTMGVIPHVVPLAIDTRANMRFGPAVPLDGATVQNTGACTEALERALAETHRRLA